MKIRAFIFASTLIFLISMASLCFVLGAGRTAAIGFLTLSVGLLFGLLVYVLDKHVSKTREGRQAVLEAALVTSSYGQAQATASSNGSMLFRRPAVREQLFPESEMSHGADKLSRPAWLPEDLRKHW